MSTAQERAVAAGIVHVYLVRQRQLDAQSTLEPAIEVDGVRIDVIEQCPRGSQAERYGEPTTEMSYLVRVSRHRQFLRAHEVEERLDGWRPLWHALALAPAPMSIDYRTCLPLRLPVGRGSASA